MAWGFLSNFCFTRSLKFQIKDNSFFLQKTFMIAYEKQYLQNKNYKNQAYLS